MPVAWSVVAGIVSLLLYLVLTPATVGGGDSGEFTLVLAVGGVPHPPGYPLYTVLGHLWVTLGHAAGLSWARAANTFSALGAAIAIGLIHAFTARLIPTRTDLSPGSRVLLAFFATVLFGLHPAWLEQATLAEVHSWHIAHLAALAVLALTLLQGAADESPASRTRRLFGFGLLCGAGLANHPTSVFFSGPLTVAVLSATWRAGRKGPLGIAVFLAGGILPLIAHGFTLYRAFHPAPYQWPLLEPTSRSVLGHLSGNLFGVFLGRFAPSPDQAQLLSQAVYPALLLGLVALLVGLVTTHERGRRWILVAVLSGGVLQLAFVFFYGVPDCVPYFLPLLFLAAAGLAVAAGVVVRHLRHPVVVLTVAAAVVVVGVAGVRGAISANERLAALDEAIRARWLAIPFQRGIVMWHNDRYTRLVAFQLLLHEQTALDVQNPAMLTWPAPRRAFAARHGFDPLGGLLLRDDSDLPLIAPNIARQTTLPVLDFALWRP